MYIRVDDSIEIKEYKLHNRTIGHVVTRLNKDASTSILCRGTLEDCMKFCGVDKDFKIVRLEQLKTYLDTLLDGKKVRGLALSLSDIRTCEHVYHELASGNCPEFINANVRTILEK